MASSIKYIFGIVLVTGIAVLLFPGFLTKKSNSGSVAIPATVDYNFHVKPIISDRCFKCHGPDESKQESELGLHNDQGLYKELMDEPGRYVIVPGKPEQSELYLRLTSEDPDHMMPPPESNLTVSTWEKAVIKKWIEQGAKYKKHWAFIEPEKPPLPETGDNGWASTEIDHFILAKLKEHQLKPNEAADKARLLRRVSYDLTGLPPTLEQLDRFTADDAPDAYEKMVDELLASTAYGEHQAAHWLDVARYGDSHGYQDDSYRSAWPWRDWVIHAFNTNLPYDEFITWQLAGDLLPEPTAEQLLATGFCRNHKITQEGGVIEEEYRVEYIADETNVYGQALLGLTFECARCHDHKYDPISQEEYFSTFAFFNQSNEKGYYGDVSNVSIAEQPVIVPTKEELEGILHFVNAAEADTVVSQIMQEVDEPRKTFVLRRGQYDLPGKEVDFATPAAVLGFPENLPRNRLGLAQWTFDAKNPLTARVAVNRIWQQFFGHGLVKSADNFGSQGDQPSHPGLLDWLAVDFRENGWNIKRLLKQIVLSSTYRQSSKVTPSKLSADRENRLLARGPRQRLTAEMIRDSWLSISGLLNPTVGGPPVRPYQPEGLWAETTPGEGRGSLTKYVEDTGGKLYRRSLYTIWKRTMPPPYMINFDASYRDVCKVKRQNTNTPLQALNLMNDPQMLESSRYFAEQLLHDASLDDAGRIEKAFRSITCRMPAGSEVKSLTVYFAGRQEELRDKEETVAQLLAVGEKKPDPSVDPVAAAALMEVIQMVFNMDESITR